MKALKAIFKIKQNAKSKALEDFELTDQGFKD
jgi:hypothetical protein